MTKHIDINNHIGFAYIYTHVYIYTCIYIHTNVTFTYIHDLYMYLQVYIRTRIHLIHLRVVHVHTVYKYI